MPRNVCEGIQSCCRPAQESMLVSTNRTNLGCTGALTAELALATVEMAVNSSRKLSCQVDFRAVSCHVLWLMIGKCTCIEVGSGSLPLKAAGLSCGS